MLPNRTFVRIDVPRSNVSVLALPENPLRMGFSMINDTGSICYINMGSAPASTTYHNVRLGTNVMEHGFLNSRYTGEVRVIWGSGGLGALRILEVIGNGP